MKHIKQLDSIRAIAVILVLISHWFAFFPPMNKLQLGSIGVDIFFVLSGFLITKILLDSKEEISVSKSAALKNFYIRRTLRIFPIYYLTIFFLLVINNYTGTNVKSAFPYLLTYTQNYYFYNRGSWDGAISHLWSLAVEEQFYLVWPWLILFINKKYLVHTIIIFIVIGVFSQFYFRETSMGAILTISCFDSFGLGALLAWQITYKYDYRSNFFLWFMASAALSLIILISSVFIKTWVPFRTLVSIISLWLITYIVINYNNENLKFKFILNNKVLIYIGKISYGIYLYHRIVGVVINSAFIDKYLNPYLPDFLYKKHWGELYLVENTILLVLISWFSYSYIEKPFLNLKKYFTNDKRKMVLQNV